MSVSIPHWVRGVYLIIEALIFISCKGTVRMRVSPALTVSTVPSTCVQHYVESNVGGV